MTEKKTYAQRAQDRVARAERTARWGAAFDEMRERTGASVKDFCTAYDLDDTSINHIIAGRRGATWEKIRAVDKALRKVLGSLAFPDLDNPVDKVSVKLGRKKG